MDEDFGAGGDGAGDLAEVAGHPGRAHGGFDLVDRRYRGRHGLPKALQVATIVGLKRGGVNEFRAFIPGVGA